jgi:hypothetical protein
MAAVVARRRSRKLWETGFQCIAWYFNLSHDERELHMANKPGVALGGTFGIFTCTVTIFNSNVRVSLREMSSEKPLVKNYPYKNIGLRRVKRYLDSLTKEVSVEGGFIINSYILGHKNIPLKIQMLPFKMLASTIISLDSYIMSIVQLLTAEGAAHQLLWTNAPNLTSKDFKSNLSELGLAKNIMFFYGLLRVNDSSLSVKGKIVFLKDLYIILRNVRLLLAKNANERVFPEVLSLDLEAIIIP